MLFRVKFGKEVSKEDMLISSLLESYVVSILD